MVNLYEILNIPEDANVIAIQRAIRLARDRQDTEERYLKLAENYLLDDKRRAQYNKQIGVKTHARRNGLSVGTDWRYVGGGITAFPGFRLSDGMSKAAVAFLTRQLAA